MGICANCGVPILDRRCDALLCRRCDKAARWARVNEYKKRQRLVQNVEEKLGKVVDSLPVLIKRFDGDGELRNLRAELKELLQSLRGD